MNTQGRVRGHSIRSLSEPSRQFVSSIAQGKRLQWVAVHSTVEIRQKRAFAGTENSIAGVSILMKSFALSLAALTSMFLIGLNGVRASDSSATRKVAKPVHHSAPRINCGITMQHWCIIAGPGRINMLDDGNYRTWTILSEESSHPSIIVRENKLCDSPAGFQAKKISEKDYVEAGEHRHAVTISLTGRDTCTMRVEYLAGTDDRARVSQRMAKYWLYACADASCSTPLLDIVSSQPGLPRGASAISHP